MSEESKLFAELPKSFHNPHEYNAEYVLIPGGCYSYQGITETEVPNIYFAKYPVTVRLYCRFIRYLGNMERELLEILPKSEFDRRFIEFASGIEKFGDYLEYRPHSDNWPEELKELRLRYDAECERPSSDNDQAIAGVTWYAARAYCYWLSLLEVAGENFSYDKAADLYRLPSEIEWEWAASGGKREYPWLPEKGAPNKKLANYNKDVGMPTPVGRYPDGATPEGLMDMAGNVWEWMENWYNEFKFARSLRGGSWSSAGSDLCCSERNSYGPNNPYKNVGFRVVRSQS